MTTVHLYTSKKHRTQPFFRLLCTKEYFEETEFIKKGIWGRVVPVSVTSNHSKVTCPECLKILIPQIESELEIMKNAFRKGAPEK